jgi:hypothetical protein
MTLQELILDCARKGLSANTSYDKARDRIEYIITIGSKSGTGTLYEVDGKIILETRYQTMDEVSSYDDIGQVAWRWFCNYKDREPFTSPDSQWVDFFVDKGWIKVEKEVVTKYVVNR